MGKIRPHGGEALLRSYKVNTDAPPILTTRSLPGPQLTALRIMAGQEHLGLTEQLPVEDTFLIGVSTTGVSHHEVLGKTRSRTRGGFAANSMRIYQMSDELRIDISESYEIVDLMVPRSSLDTFTEEEGYRRVGNLSCEYGVVDPTIASLTRALLPFFDRPQEASTLFVDSVGLTVIAHLVGMYGDCVRPFVAKGGLTPVQVNRVKEILAANLKGDLRVSDLARECSISWQHLICALKQTTGWTPHQWLRWKRVDYAKELLRNTGLPIGDIALRCGFADQCHLTRVFNLLERTTPAAWREQNQSWLQRKSLRSGFA